MLRTTHANGRYLKVDGSGTAVLECLEHVMGVLARICKGKKKKKKPSSKGSIRLSSSFSSYSSSCIKE